MQAVLVIHSCSSLCFHCVEYGSLCGLAATLTESESSSAFGDSHFTAKSSGKQTYHLVLDRVAPYPY